MMRTVLLGLAMAALASAAGGQSHDIDTDLSDRAKWKSFGVENYMEFDPLERAYPSQKTVIPSDWRSPPDRSQVGQLKALIAFAEAGPKGYDAVHTSARVKPPHAPTQMTLGQVKRWIRDTPGQPHAIGRYQFIPSTLNGLQRRAGVSDATRFSPDVQDQLADYLLVDAGINAFTQGKMSRTRFMNNLARIWAGLPLSSGKSAYHGYAGNRATISTSFYRREMQKIFGG